MSGKDGKVPSTVIFGIGMGIVLAGVARANPRLDGWLLGAVAIVAFGMFAILVTHRLRTQKKSDTSSTHDIADDRVKDGGRPLQNSAPK